ncbi:MAG: DUF4276 family protein [Acidobacteriota bacterium]
MIVFVEEESAEAALQSILPKLLPESELQIIRFQGKQNMLRHLPARLRGLQSWLPDNHLLLVLIDRDSDDCRQLKAGLERIAIQAGLVSKSAARSGSRFQIVNRIAIEELESWFFGDWKAVRRAYPKAPVTIPSQARYRDPDAISGGTWEALERILQNKGYCKSGLRKIELARSVAPHMEPSRNNSRSFQVFRDAIVAAAAP